MSLIFAPRARPALPTCRPGHILALAAMVSSLLWFDAQPARAAAAVGGTSAAPAAAPTESLPAVDAAVAQKVRDAVNTWLNGRFSVDEVRATPFPGLLEVRLGKALVYVDPEARFAVVEGQLVRLADGRNVTQERIADLERVSFDELPLKDAFKMVIGDGRRTMAIFEDPNCGYCKRLRAELPFLSDVTVYTFPYAILAKDSATKARKAWCASDPSKAWDDLLTSSVVPDNDGTCDNPIDRVLELGRSLNVTGTPTIFFTNGKRVPGAVPIDQIEKMLEEAQPASKT